MGKDRRPRRMQVAETTYLTRIFGKGHDPDIFIHTDETGAYLPSLYEIRQGKPTGESYWNRTKKSIGSLNIMGEDWNRKALSAARERAGFLTLSKNARKQFSGTRIAATCVT